LELARAWAVLLHRCGKRAVCTEYSCNAFHSGRLVWQQGLFDTGNFIAQGQAPFFQSAHHQLVYRRLVGRLVDQGIQVTVLHPQRDQAPLWGIQVEVQGELRK
jgi:hypothetical protein